MSDVRGLEDGYDWAAVTTDLDGYGCAVLKGLLDRSQCEAIAAMYAEAGRFRSHIVMARHGFGRGEYKYFSYPLPDQIAARRTGLYPRLAPIANRWNESMAIVVRYPDEHAAFIDRCHRA